MKLSELIGRCSSLIAEYGDVEVRAGDSRNVGSFPILQAHHFERVVADPMPISFTGQAQAASIETRRETVTVAVIKVGPR